MKILATLVLLLSLSVFANDTDECFKICDKGFDRCMMHFGRSDDTAAICEDSYHYCYGRCLEDVKTDDSSETFEF